MLRGKHHAHGPGGEVVEGAPGVDIDEQPLPRMVQQDGAALETIIEGDMKGTAQGNNHLLETLMGMTAPTFAAWHVVDPIGTLDVEGHHRLSLGKRQIATWIGNLRKIYNLNV